MTVTANITPPLPSPAPHFAPCLSFPLKLDRNRIPARKAAGSRATGPMLAIAAGDEALLCALRLRPVGCAAQGQHRLIACNISCAARMQIAGETLPAERPPNRSLIGTAVGQAVLLKLYKQDAGLLPAGKRVPDPRDVAGPPLARQGKRGAPWHPPW